MPQMRPGEVGTQWKLVARWRMVMAEAQDLGLLFWTGNR